MVFFFGIPLTIAISGGYNFMGKLLEGNNERKEFLRGCP
jgi:hypothetical protein